MKRILILIIAFFLLVSTKVFAQGMSKYGYPNGYAPNYTAKNKQQYNYNNTNGSGLFPSFVNPAILSENNMLSILFSDLGLNYGEYNNGAAPSINSKYLDTDNGFLNGIAVNLAKTYNNWYTNVNFSYYITNDTYSGYIPSISGTPQNLQETYQPLTQTSSSKIYNFNLKEGYMIPITNKFVITPYGELGWHIWDRGDNTAQYAHYSNWLAMVGILAQYAITPELVGNINFGYGTTFDAQAKENNNASGGAVYCQNGDINSCIPSGISEDTITFNLGSKAIYNISAGLDYRFYSNFHIIGNVNYERFEYGQSSTVYLTPTNIYSNGVLVNQLSNGSTEPSSVTNEIIYSIGIGYSF
jgi:hypothetical protein